MIVELVLHIASFSEVLVRGERVDLKLAFDHLLQIQRAACRVKIEPMS